MNNAHRKVAAIVLIAGGLLVSCRIPEEFDGMTHFTDVFFLVLAIAVIGAAVSIWNKRRKE